jgi:CysZ protein
MRFLKNAWMGLKAYRNALYFIAEHKLYWYVCIPAVLMLGIYEIGYLILKNQPNYHARNMNEISWLLIQLLIEISISLALMRFAKYVVVVILSPLLSFLSQKVEYKLTGNTYRFDLKQLIHDVKRGLRIATRNIMWEYAFFILVYIFARIGWDKAESSPLFYLVFIVSFYYYGFAFLDYVNERLKLTVDQSIQFTRKNRGMALAIGGVYSILIWVPVELDALFDWTTFGNNPFEFLYRFVVNLILWMLASFAPIWSIVAATLAMNDLVDLKKTREIVISDFSTPNS